MCGQPTKSTKVSSKRSIVFAVKFGGRKWTRTLRSFVEFVMASRSLLDLTPQSRCPAFFLQVLLGGLWSRSTRTPTHRRESILVVINNYIRFLEVAFMKSTISAKIIEALTPMFARFGFPFSLRTDNGPQFVSEEFEAFLRTNGIQHQKLTPLWPKEKWSDKIAHC